MVKARLFLGSLLLTVICLSGWFYINRPKPVVPGLVRVADGVYYAPQITPKDVAVLARNHFKTIVDLRPDGEAKDQASSEEIEGASRRFDIAFHYVPVPHESIPDDAVDNLREVIAKEPKPAVLYCRTGRRAVRTFALTQASQGDGPTAASILAMVKSAGFTADDLKDKIDERVAHRTTIPTENK